MGTFRFRAYDTIRYRWWLKGCWHQRISSGLFSSFLVLGFLVERGGGFWFLKRRGKLLGT